MKKQASVEERGNGFPALGDYVQGDDGGLYIVVRTGTRIETQDCGRGNLCHGYVLGPVDWADLGEGEQLFPGLAILEDP